MAGTQDRSPWDHPLVDGAQGCSAYPLLPPSLIADLQRLFLHDTIQVPPEPLPRVWVQDSMATLETRQKKASMYEGNGAFHAAQCKPPYI